ncbi:MAG: copper-binding protein [Deltaproteobacteria bacterium]|nr:copper-binding protein [Deltaproteobacteria bacterium]
MRTLLLVFSLVLGSACGGSPAPSAPTASAEAHSTRGTIEEVRDEGRVLVIAHDEIPGYMRAMTMPFELAPEARNASLKKGDAIEFTFVTTDDGKRVITKIVRK